MESKEKVNTMQSRDDARKPSRGKDYSESDEEVMLRKAQLQGYRSESLEYHEMMPHTEGPLEV